MWVPFLLKRKREITCNQKLTNCEDIGLCLLENWDSSLWIVNWDSFLRSVKLWTCEVLQPARKNYWEGDLILTLDIRPRSQDAVDKSPSYTLAKIGPCHQSFSGAYGQCRSFPHRDIHAPCLQSTEVSNPSALGGWRRTRISPHLYYLGVDNVGRLQPFHSVLCARLQELCTRVSLSEQNKWRHLYNNIIFIDHSSFNINYIAFKLTWWWPKLNKAIQHQNHSNWVNKNKATPTSTFTMCREREKRKQPPRKLEYWTLKIMIIK